MLRVTRRLADTDYVHDQLSRVAKRVVVAHPGQTRLIFRGKRKNDRIDAKKLATLLFLDQVPTVHVPSLDVRSWRNLIEFRPRLAGDEAVLVQREMENRLSWVIPNREAVSRHHTHFRILRAQG